MTTSEALQPSRTPRPITSVMPAIDVPSETTPRAERLVSLDVFRGVTIAAMLLVNNGGKGTPYWALEHADWHGWTPTDLIFPFFLFIVGVAIPFSLAKRTAMTADGSSKRRSAFWTIWGRALALFMLGELLTGLPYRQMDPAPEGFHNIQILRIAVWAFGLIGILLLLMPWKSATSSIVFPLLIGVLFYGLAFGINYANHYWLREGLPESFKFGSGLLYPHDLRIPGVLQRIGICYGVAATIALWFGWRTALAAAVFLCVVYSGLMLNAPFPDHEVGSLTMEDNLARRIDEKLLIREVTHEDGTKTERWNHAYRYPDNEGALSTLPAIASVLLGICAGVWLRTFHSTGERAAGLLVFGLFTLLAGFALNKWLMPINKNIWTPSFTVFTAGMALLCLGTCFYFVDVLGYKKWAWPFKVYGMNAIAAFVAAGIAARVLALVMITPPGSDTKVALGSFLREWSAQIVHASDLVQNAHVKAWIGTEQNQSLAFALLFVAAIFVLMWFLYVCRIFIKV